MKLIKKGLCIIIFLISLFILNTNINAYNIFETNHSGMYTEIELYNEFSKIENFNINEYKNIFCTGYGSYPSYSYCYAVTDTTINSFNYQSPDSFMLGINNYENCGYYYVFLYKYNTANQSSGYQTCNYNNGFITFYSSNVLSNFNFNFFDDEVNNSINVLDFSEYMSTEEEIAEPEINIKATKLLNFIIDKAKNIYEVLINNEIFLFILSVPLVYLGFLIIYKILKR